jgi:hypothetical protein
MDKHKYMLSTNRGVAHSRIWLEGQRLKAAEFRYGRRFKVEWTPATVTLTLVSDGEAPQGRAKGYGRVSGSVDRPVIDIVGAQVVETFSKAGDNVSVTFALGVITIRRAS